MKTTPTAVAAVLLVTLGLTGTAAGPAAAHAPAPAQCAASTTVKETLPNGTTWELCWRMNARSGLVLENVAVSSARYPAPVRVLKSLTWRPGQRRDAGQAVREAGHDLVLRALSRVGWYEYVTEYRLHDDGQISARLGATGDLSPEDYGTVDKDWPIGKGKQDYATNHYHSAFWRVDFDIAGDRW
jgi:hypothetical protein